MHYRIASAFVCSTITNMRIIANTTDRFYAEDVDDALPPVTHVGRRRMTRAQPPLEAHTHGGALEIVCVTRGQIGYEIDNRRFEVKGGEIFLTLPGELHGTGGQPEERTDICWIGIDSESPGAWLPASLREEGEALLLRIRAFPVRQFRGVPGVRENIERVIALLLSDLPYRRMAAAAAVTVLLTALAEAERSEEDRAPGGVVQRAMDMIENNLEERIVLQTLADRLHLSLPHFKKIFREEAGMPPYEYIQRRKIECAKQLLADTALPVTEIAFRLGFPSSQHFAVRFRKLTAQTPTAYRRRQALSSGVF